MTGFGASEGTVLGGRLRIEIRTVNHRYFNAQVKLPFDLAGVEAELRERLRQLLDRGHVAVTARWLETPEAETTLSLDLVRARQVVAALKELKKKLRLKGEPDLAFVARQPEVLALGGNGQAAATWADVQPIVEQAVSEVLGMREREGRALADDLRGRLAALEAGAQAVEGRAPARLAAEHERLRKAIAELAGNVKVRSEERRVGEEGNTGQRAYD